MVRSQSRVKARVALSLAVAVTALLAASASAFVAPPRALAYYGRPNIADSYETSTTYSCQQMDPESSMQTGGFATAADGSMWIAENDSNFVSNGRSALVHLSGTGLLIDTTPLPSQFTGLGGAAFGPDGKLYVTCRTSQSVLVYDIPTRQVVAQVGDSSVFDTPVDLEFDRNGNLFVVDPFGHVTGSTADGQVVRYNSTFTSHTAFNAESSPYGALSFPHGLCVDALNDVWVADSVNNRIMEFDNNGTALTEVRPQDAGADALSSPQDVYVDVYNTLYIVDQKDFGDPFTSGRFARYAADGTFLGEYRTKPNGFLNGPTKIWVNSPVFSGDVFVDDQITDTGQGVAGLVERWSLQEVNPDVTAPITTVLNPPVGWQHTTQQIALSAEDTQSGVASTVWGYSAGSLSAYTTTITVAAEGTTTIYYRSTDTSGNVEAFNNIQVKIDRNAPQTTAVGIPNPPIFYTTPAGSLTTSDSVSGVQSTFWRTDGGSWVSGTALVLPSSLGTHTLDYYSTDVSGLTETTHSVAYQVLNHTEQDDGRVLNQGTWSTVTTAAAFGGSYGTAVGSGSRSLVTFKGTRLDYYATTGPAFGKANVRIDGGTATPVDLYTSSVTYRRLIWTTGQVSDATHTVEIAWSGNKNSSSTSATIDVDAVDTVGFVGMADTDPPSTAAQYAPSNAATNWVRPDLTVTLTASDTVSGVDHTYYSSDNTTPSLIYSNPLTFSADGVTTFKYRSVDRVGNTEPVHTATLRVDGTAPITTCTVLPSYASSATIMLVPTDAGSGVAQTRYSLDGSAATSGTVMVTTAVGSHTLAFGSTDIAGNVEPTQTVAFDVLSQNDQTSPMAYYRGPWSTGSVAGSYGGTTASLNSAGGAYFSFTGTRVDLRSVMGPNMGDAQVNIDGASAGTIDYYATSTGSPQVVFSATGLANTSHTVQLLWLGSKNPSSSGTSIGLDAIDLLGNLTADTQAPVTGDNTDGLWHKDSFTLALTPSDQGSWVATTYASIAGSTTVYTAPMLITAEGTTTVDFWSVDGAGNREATHTVQVLVDNVDPNSWDNLPTTWQHTPITVTLSASDSESGVQKILYTVGLSAETLYSAPFVVSQEGSIPVEYYAVDKASNTEALNTAYALVDLSAPITTDNAPAGWVRNPVDVSLNATDTYSGVAQTIYGLNGAAPSIVATSPIHIATEGTTSIAYRSSDVAGNVESTRTTTVRIDSTAPVTTSNAASSYATTGTVILTPTDSASGVASTQWRIDSGSWTTGTVATLPLVAGQHVLQWASTDVAGNVEATRSATYQMMQRWEQTDSRMYFKGSWSTSSSPSYSGHSMASVNATQCSLFFNFTGTRFDIIGSSGPAFGYAKVTVDGTNVGNADFYSATPADSALILSTAGLANSSHIVRIDWTGTKNAASTGTGISIDAIDMIGQITSDTVAPVTTSDATSAWRATNATITLTANDVNSFVANSFYRIGSTTTTYAAPFVISAEGTTGVQFWSVDGAGNIETSTVTSVRIDKTAPVTSDDSTSSWQKGPVNVHLTSTDSLSGVAAVYFSLDGSNPSRVATGGLVTISAEGTTTLKYKAVDAVGNTESIKTATIRIDNTVPGTTDNASPSWVKAPATVTLTSSDALSGIANTYYSTDGSNPATVASGPLSISTDGTTTLKYYSRDNAGNAETTKTVAVKVDAAAPVTTVTVQPEYSGSATIALAASDPESGVSSTHWRFDGSAWATGSVATTSTGGTHLLEFYSVDGVGNVESVKSATFDLAVRTESSALNPTPKSVWTTSSNASDSAGSERYTTYNGAYCAFTFMGTGFHLIGRKDAYGGTGTITVDGNATYTVNFYNASTQYQQVIQTVTGLPDEQHVVTLTCSNGLGKRVHFDAVDLIGYLTTSTDNSPPITVDNTDGLWHNAPFAFALVADDTQHNVANTYYALNGGALQSYVGTFTISTDGTNSVDYYSVDSKGNTEATNTAYVLIDRSAPVSSSDVATGWLAAPTTVHLSATDPYSGVAGTRYGVNGSAAATYTTGIGVAAEGTTTIAFASVDNVGNLEATKTAMVRLDFTAPVTSSNATSSYLNTATITLTPVDAGSGVAQTLWSLDGSASTSGTVVTTTAVGSHTLTYSSTDKVG
ncbi:MAG: chitobiase/beta-hexosaminidase C-terminal domain-containing protein, partial [Coriobacteriia bacterium]|nr:chitobiase/beta-hexosaminidase C-terminal domain-containing protein [Coriobacteriia bacterium]